MNFTIAEAVGHLGVTEPQLRQWIDRTPADFKPGTRIELGIYDLFRFAIVRDLVGFGVSVRQAISFAWNLGAPVSLAAAYRLVVTRNADGAFSIDKIAAGTHFDPAASSLIIPAARVMGEMQRIYTEAA